MILSFLSTLEVPSAKIVGLRALGPLKVLCRARGSWRLSRQMCPLMESVRGRSSSGKVLGLPSSFPSPASWLVQSFSNGCGSKK